jgi:hypothetical protein
MTISSVMAAIGSETGNGKTYGHMPARPAETTGRRTGASQDRNLRTFLFTSISP